MNDVSGPSMSGDHEPENLPDLDSERPTEWEDADRLNAAFAAISDDLFEWAEHHAEMHDWADEGWRDGRPE